LFALASLVGLVLGKAIEVRLEAVTSGLELEDSGSGSASRS
jgi:hypothetical protein